MSEIVTGALFMFLLKESSRNAYNNDRRDAIFAKNYFRHLKLRLPHLTLMPNDTAQLTMLCRQLAKILPNPLALSEDMTI